MSPRPRERYLLEGPERHAEAELLALVLGTGTRGRSALHIAHDLLDRYGSCRALAREPVASLAAFTGIGPARAVRVHAACALAARPPAVGYGHALSGPEAAAELLIPHFAALPHEELHALYLDRKLRLRSQQRLTVGNDGFTIVDPRQVLRPAVALGVGAVLLAHNHPSGDPTPSTADVDVTLRVAEAAEVLDIQLVDHLVIGGQGWTSLAARGVLRPWRRPPPALA